MDAKQLITTALAAKAYKRLKNINVDEAVKPYIIETKDYIEKLKSQIDARVDTLDNLTHELKLVSISQEDLDTLKASILEKISQDKSDILNKIPTQETNPRGKDGVGIECVQLFNSELIVKLTDEKTINLGKIIPDAVRGDQGEPGVDGRDGVDGVGIVSALIQNDELIFNLSDGRQLNVGNVKGSQGEPGQPPKHEWKETKLRFQNPDGSWGKWVDLKGPAGKDGRSGGGGASVVKQVGSSLAVSNQGAEISQNVTAINFTGDATVTQTSSGKVDVHVTSSGGGIGFDTIVATTSRNLNINTIYITMSNSDIDLTLPPVAPIGSIIKILMFGDGGFVVRQNMSQVIHFGKKSTNIGTTGNIKTTQPKSTLELICISPNNEWIVASSVGNFIINFI
jgi:hypothetical protein